MKTEKKPEEKVCIKDCLIINKRESCEVFDLDAKLLDEDLEKAVKPLYFLPPGDQDDYVYYYSPGLSIGKMIDIASNKYGISFYSGIFGPMVSVEELGFSEINRKGFKLIKVSSMESLKPENITGWRKANAREALEFFLIGVLQSPLSKDYSKIINMLWKYFENGDGYYNLSDSFDKKNFVGIRLRTSEKIIIDLFENDRNKIGQKILNLEIKMNSIWVRE